MFYGFAYYVVAGFEGAAVEGAATGTLLFDRVIGQTFDTTSISGFLFGSSSLLAGLTATSAYTCLTEKAMEYLKEQKNEPFITRFTGFFKDKAVVLTVLMTIVTVVHIIAKAYWKTGTSGMTGMLISGLILALWVYLGFLMLKETTPMSYILNVFIMAAIDAVFPMPAYQSEGIIIQASLFLALRLGCFILVGALNGVYLNLREDVLNNYRKPRKTHPKRFRPSHTGRMDSLWSLGGDISGPLSFSVLRIFLVLYILLQCFQCDATYRGRIVTRTPKRVSGKLFLYLGQVIPTRNSGRNAL